MVVVVKRMQEFLRGKLWSCEILDQVFGFFEQEIYMVDNVLGGMV